jgi:hypothetical protein
VFFARHRGKQTKNKQMKTRALIFTLGIGVLLSLGACNKDRNDWKDTQTASDSEQAEGIADDAINIADNAARGGSEVARTASPVELYEAMSGCATVTRDTVSVPRVMTIDFGPTNCLCNDGRYRRGKIIVTYAGGGYFDQGSVKTVSFDNYYRNDNKVEGTRTVTNNGRNAANQLSWTINAQNMKITRPDGSFHTWNSTRVRTMLNGESTPSFWRDDEYSISGSAEGINAKGISYVANITTPLHRKLDCRWIDSGIVEISPEGKATRTLDYGNGACDRLLTVTVRNKSRTIEMN